MIKPIVSPCPKAQRPERTSLKSLPFGSVVSTSLVAPACTCGRLSANLDFRAVVGELTSNRLARPGQTNRDLARRTGWVMMRGSIIAVNIVAVVTMPKHVIVVETGLGL